MNDITLWLHPHCNDVISSRNISDFSCFVRWLVAPVGGILSISQLVCFFKDSPPAFIVKHHPKVPPPLLRLVSLLQMSLATPEKLMPWKIKEDGISHGGWTGVSFNSRVYIYNFILYGVIKSIYCYLLYLYRVLF